MIDPSSLKISSPNPYVFKSPIQRSLVRWVDRIGGFFSKPDPQPVDWTSVRKIAVLRLDHLGDVLMALPFLENLLKVLPNAEIDLYVGPWAREVAKLSGLKIGIKVYEAPWFNRSRLEFWSRKGIEELSRILKEGGYDAVVDLRGDFRQILAMKWSGIPVRVGQVVTGGGFLLTHPLIYRSGLHEIERNLDALVQLGLKKGPEKSWPRLVVKGSEEKAASTKLRSLGIKGPFAVLHATCAAPAKRWPKENWKVLVEKLPAQMTVLIVGSKSEEEDASQIFGACRRKVVFAMGTFPLAVLAAVLKKCSLFIGVDSAPAHIAAAVGAPVVSLFSGTNEASQWGPRGSHVEILQKKTPCSPCERTVCPIGHDCMVQIGVEKVLDRAKSLLSSSV